MHTTVIIYNINKYLFSCKEHPCEHLTYTFFCFVLPFAILPHHFTYNIFSTPHTECLVAGLQTLLGDLVINMEMKKPTDKFWTDLQSLKNESTLMDNK